jgi:hypothetical protein
VFFLFWQLCIISLEDLLILATMYHFFGGWDGEILNIMGVDHLGTPSYYKQINVLFPYAIQTRDDT